MLWRPGLVLSLFAVPLKAVSPREFVEHYAMTYGLWSAYTVVPVQRSCLLDYPFHLQRMAMSLRQLHPGGERALPDTRQLDAAVSGAICGLRGDNLSGYLTLCAHLTAELEPRVNALLTPKDIDLGLGTPTPPHGVTVDTVEYRRERWEAKYAGWTLERRPLEANRRPIAAETVLTEKSPEMRSLLLEGMTSNLFVIENGEVVTAAEGVLHGSMASLLMRHLREERLPIALRKPSMDDCDKWSAVFLTSEA